MSFVTAIVIAVIVIMALTLFYAVKWRTFAKMSMRNAFRRKLAMLLIIAGSLTGTAFIVGSFVINDSFQYYMYSGIRHNLGRIDEAVAKTTGFSSSDLNLLTSKLSESSYVDAVLPIAARDTVAAPVGKIRSLDPSEISQVVFIGVDATQLKKFGSGKLFPDVRLSGDSVVIGSALAKALKLKVGDSFQALTNTLQYLFGTPPTLKVAGIAPETGVLGYKGTQGFMLPVFVSLKQASDLFGIGVNTVLIANKGDYISGASHTKEIDQLVKDSFGTSVKVDNLKENQLKAVNQGQIGFLFLLLSGFSIAAGILLLINVYTMLADERKSDLGTLRAIGFTKGRVGFILFFEGFVYSLIASIFGVLAGIGVAWFMIDRFSGLISNVSSEVSGIMTMGTSTFVLHYSATSIIYGLLIGLMVPLAVLGFTSFRIGRLNIVNAVRNIPEDPSRNVRKFFYSTMAFFIIMLAIAVLGNFVFDAFTMYLGVIGSAFIFPSFFKKGRLKRLIGNFMSVGVIVFAFASSVIPYVQAANETSLYFLGLKSFSVLLSTLFLLSYNFEIFDKFLGVFSRKSGRAAVKLAVAETSQHKGRTGLTIAMYSIVIFVISLMTVVPYSEIVQLNSSKKTIFEGYDAIGTPLPVVGRLPLALNEMSNLDFVTYYATASMSSVKYSMNGQIDRQIYQMVQVNKKLFDGSILKIKSAVPGITNLDSLWSYLNEHPGTVAVFGISNIKPGQEIKVSNEGFSSFNFGSGNQQEMDLLISGPLKNAKTMKVAAVFQNNSTFNAFPSGFYTTGKTVAEFGKINASDFLLAKLAGDTEAAKASSFNKFTAFLKTKFIFALFSQQTVDLLSNTIMGFVNIVNSFLYFGLSVGIIGLAILIIKSLHERRRTIGILKAIGFTRMMVFRSFLLETNFVVILGILIGFVSGIITSYLIYSTLGLGRMFIPWYQLVILGVVFYGISILATLIPTNAASKIPPVEALRYYE